MLQGLRNRALSFQTDPASVYAGAKAKVIKAELALRGLGHGSNATASANSCQKGNLLPLENLSRFL